MSAVPKAKENETPQELEARLKAERLDERERLGLPPDAPEELVKAARGEAAEKDDPDGSRKEATVLAWLLGDTKPLEFDCDAWMDTPDGRQKLVFHFRQLDGSKIDELEKENSEQTLLGRTVDRPRLNAALVASALIYFEDGDGNQVRLDDETQAARFRGPIPSLIEPMLTRFRYQPGILAQVAEEIRVAAGLGGDRVDTARRAEGKAPSQPASKTIAEAVGGS